MAIPYVAAGVGLGLSKRAENKRRQAAANEYSRKYPLTDDCPSMEASIQTAVVELRNLDKLRPKNAGEKRVKNRNSATLRSWLLVMREHLKDLTCGINVASTVVAAPAPVIATKEIVAPPAIASDVLPVEQTIKATEETVVDEVAGSQNLAAPTKKKGVNWLLIGGLAVGAVVIFKFMKKN